MVSLNRETLKSLTIYSILLHKLPNFYPPLRQFVSVPNYLHYGTCFSLLNMLSSVLKSPQATKINIEIIRAFIRMRHALNINKELSQEMKELKSFVLKNSQKNDQEFQKIWDTINKLMTPAKNQRKIGFHLH